MSQRTETVVIGAGPAGLACSHHLTRHQREHVVIDQGRVGETWRTCRWDGFRLNTPSFFLNLPGSPYDGLEPDGFLTGAETVAYLERCAAESDAPVRTGLRVLRVERHTPRYRLETSDGSVEADNVVVATGAFQRPAPLPPGASHALVEHVHAGEYRRPDHLPPGRALSASAHIQLNCHALCSHAAQVSRV